MGRRRPWLDRLGVLVDRRFDRLGLQGDGAVREHRAAHVGADQVDLTGQ